MFFFRFVEYCIWSSCVSSNCNSRQRLLPLFMSKSRLAPIRNKTMTISRLELQAAVLASRLKVIIVDELKLNIGSVRLWSGSATVLKYIGNENVNFRQFKMHRANEIRNNSNIQDWRFIPTELNVADDCSRVIIIKHNTLTNKHHGLQVQFSYFNKISTQKLT